MNKQLHWKKVGALSFALGGLLYLLAEKVSSRAWTTPPYFFSKNYISDLGIAQCGVLPDGRDVCSPLHAVMNSGFAAEGLLFFLACLLLRANFTGFGRSLFLLTGLLHGIGGVTIALFHSGTEASGFTVHQAGAIMAIGGGNLCLITVGWLVRKRSGIRDYSLFSGVLGCVGLLSMFLIPLNLVSVGIIERASVYPITFWQIFTGVMLLKLRI
ncbi:DUF998 domain-containing protein [Erwinia sp.]|uniref:DUF998 domain-containing protein n=1 Tax=Erwinia citreus TaxID=558 RepID=UPI003C7687CD